MLTTQVHIENYRIGNSQNSNCSKVHLVSRADRFLPNMKHNRRLPKHLIASFWTIKSVLLLKIMPFIYPFM
jgi:hypothetical protein